MNAFTLTVQDRVATLVFDLPDEKVNKLSSGVMTQLDRHMDALALRDDVDVLIVRSGKRGVFIAGADILEIESITGEQDALAKSQAGKVIFSKLESLPFPSVALIDGVCLGGGLELALACSFRVATDNPKTSLGLPEVNLGIVPGWGGTWRLPRLIGFVPGLTMCVTGKPVNAKKAYRMGLVDRVLNDAFQDEQIAIFLDEVRQSSERKRIQKRRGPRGMAAWMLGRNPLGRHVAAKKARANVIAKTHGHYPAPLAAIDLVRKVYGRPASEAFSEEARVFAELAGSSVSRNLIQLFFTSESLKRSRGVVEDVTPREIQSAAVLGAGIMGGGIAWLFAYRDRAVRMKDIAWDAIAKGYETASQYFGALVKRRRLKPHEANVKMHRISGAVDYSGFTHTDIVIEAVVENLGVKKSVLRETEAVVRTDAILASNTSSLSIDEMATALEHPERFVGLHFFNPVNRMPLVEVIPGEKTSPEVTATAVELVKSLGKTPVVVQDCAGFLVNRILVPYMNEAAHLLHDGATIEEIDETLKAFGMPMGPLALCDEVGIDVGHKVANVLAEAYGERMKVSPVLDALRTDPTLLGRKSKRGFYVHAGKKTRPNPDVQKLLPRRAADATNGIRAGTPKRKDVVDRSMLIMVNEAARCLAEGVVREPSHLDMAMIMGTGFPPFRGGLLRYADARGIEDIVETLEYLASTAGERFEPAPLLVELARAKRGFYDPREKNGSVSASQAQNAATPDAPVSEEDTEMGIQKGSLR